MTEPTPSQTTEKAGFSDNPKQLGMNPTVQQTVPPPTTDSNQEVDGTTPENKPEGLPPTEETKPKEPCGSVTLIEDIARQFPTNLRPLLCAEMNYIASIRTATSELLKEQIDTEKDFYKKLTAPLPGEPAQSAQAVNGNVSRDEMEKAQLWLADLRNQLVKEEAELTVEIKTLTDKATAQAERAKIWKQDVDDGFKALQVPKDEVRKAEEALEQAKKKLQEAVNEDAKLRIPALTQAVTAAQAQSIAVGQDKGQLKDLMQQTIVSWRGARQKLMELKAQSQTAGTSLEDRQLQLKMVQKMLEYMKQYQDQMIRDYLSRPRTSDDKKNS